MKQSIRELAKANGISYVTYYKRLGEIKKKEGIYRELTKEELKPRKSGRPQKIIFKE